MRGGKALGVCIISEELIKGGSRDMNFVSNSFESQRTIVRMLGVMQGSHFHCITDIVMIVHCFFFSSCECFHFVYSVTSRTAC